MRLLQLQTTFSRNIYGNFSDITPLVRRAFSLSSCFRDATETEASTPTPNTSAGNEVFIKKKYADTLLLPKTEFPMKISYEKRHEHETNIANKSQFEQLYGFQRLWRQGQPEFILHDGPPYANGDVHIGHAVNKILKDITCRYKLLRGYQVNYIPGWDCHGLPIELKALKSGKHGILKDPSQIRDSARKVVDESIANHIRAFKRWGILAEWNSFYKTLDKNYIKAQLQSFLELFENGFVFRDMKPVFWSPSSRTALAEAELEYNASHESPSVYLGLDLQCDSTTFGKEVGYDGKLDKDAKVQAVIWTTTPWTLPSNKAVAFHNSEKYAVLDGGLKRGQRFYYVVASALHQQFCAARQINFPILFEFSGDRLKALQYKHPLFKEQSCSFIHGDHVTMEKGTGLVHIAPAHGHDDYVLGLRHNLSMDCYVDDNGNFDNTIPELQGQHVLSMGNKTIMTKLADSIICSSRILHAYPYDWRTKQPVIIKTSKQWFINTEKLKPAALEQLQNVNIYPKNVENGMLSQLIRRPYWCISRQRCWGVPIPVFYDRETDEPLINKETIDKLCTLIDKTGNTDYWWKDEVSTLLPEELDHEKYSKGNDIFDIWYDSGTSWQILGGKPADMYLEGKDQFQGWFQSSLLLSTALRGVAPYKNLYVHGFVVDDHGKKMSKSVGNVVNPADVVNGCTNKKRNHPAYGADVLRWWVAAQASADGGNLSVSSPLLRSSDEGVQKLRNVLKFLISYCNEASVAELDSENISYDELMYTDQYMLSLLNEFRKTVTSYYEDYNYHRVLMKTLHFATTEVSAQYFTWAKDRLYCDFKQSQSRKSCIYVLGQIYSTLAKVLAPILPYLVEESYSHYKLGNQSIFKSFWFEEEPTWNNKQVEALFELVIDVRETLNHVIGSNSPKNLWVELQCDAKNFNILQILHPVLDEDVDKCDSELCDILQVSGVDLQCYETEESVKSGSCPMTDPLEPIKFSIQPTGVGHSLAGYSVGVCKSEMMQCARCRRICCSPGDVLCPRCVSVMKGVLQKQSNDVQNLKMQEGPVKKKVIA